MYLKCSFLAFMTLDQPLCIRPFHRRRNCVFSFPTVLPAKSKGLQWERSQSCVMNFQHKNHIKFTFQHGL